MPAFVSSHTLNQTQPICMVMANKLAKYPTSCQLPSIVVDVHTRRSEANRLNSRNEILVAKLQFALGA